MKKNVKVLGAAAAALLAVAPVVASATVANASTVTVNPGASKPSANVNALNINATITATAGSTSVADAVHSVKLSVDNGATVNNFNSANVQILDASTNEQTSDTTIKPGKLYKIKVTDVYFSNLLTGKQWNLGKATLNGSSEVSSSTLMDQSNNTFVSAPFSLTREGATNQPFFVNNNTNAASSNVQLADGATAYAGTNGSGLKISSITQNGTDQYAKAQAILDYITKSVVSVQNGTVITDKYDIASQLKAGGATVTNGVWSIPNSGLTLTLTAKNLDSGKTVTVKVPFASTDVADTSYPVISSSQADITGQYQGFANASAQGQKQTPSANKIVMTVKPGSSFTNKDAVAPFSAVIGTYPGVTTGKLDMSVLSNPVNTNVPGQYTVTVQTTDWSVNKTTRLSYTVQVGDADTTYQVVNYPKEYGINIWAIAGNNVSFTGNRQPGQSTVATYETKTVNGVSYTRIGDVNNADTGANTWVPTEYLGKHNTNTNKPSTNGEKALSGVVTVTYNGKGAVKLMNAQGKHVDQYIKKGTAWKVFAEKTVNGVKMYRLGNQNQWVPAMYVAFN